MFKNDSKYFIKTDVLFFYFWQPDKDKLSYA